jgi:hypothetical protein
MDERKAWCGGHFTALDLLRREYAIALSDLYLDPTLRSGTGCAEQTNWLTSTDGASLKRWRR